jgi:hypothetical protein
MPSGKARMSPRDPARKVPLRLRGQKGRGVLKPMPFIINIYIYILTIIVNNHRKSNGVRKMTKNMDLQMVDRQPTDYCRMFRKCHHPMSGVNGRIFMMNSSNPKRK